jgi:RHS repeat-associated protein
VGLGYTLLGEDPGLDVLGRVVDLSWTLDGAVVDEFKYGYDASGNRTWGQVCDPNLEYDIYDEAYAYDGLNRLIETERGTLIDGEHGKEITDAAFTQQWVLDALGNWTTLTTDDVPQTRAANDANELTSVSGWITPVYDKAGNMTVAPKPGAEATTGLALTYNAWNRLVKVEQWTDSNGNHTKDTGESASTVATYRYDGLGQRIVKTLADGTRFDYYYNENWQVLEVRKNGSAFEQYLWDPAYIDTPVMRWRNADGNSSNGLEEVVYYTSDANHNVTAVVDGTPTRAHYEEVVERYVYTSYGTPTFLKNDWSPQVVSGHADGTASLFDNGLLFAGYGVDAETGFAVSRARYDDFELSWLSRDPAPTDSNLYQYCGGRPTAGTDPTGLSMIGPTPVDSEPSLWRQIATGIFRDLVSPNGLGCLIPGGIADRGCEVLQNMAGGLWDTGARKVKETEIVGDGVLSSLLKGDPNEALSLAGGWFSGNMGGALEFGAGLLDVRSTMAYLGTTEYYVLTGARVSPQKVNALKVLSGDQLVLFTGKSLSDLAAIAEEKAGQWTLSGLRWAGVQVEEKRFNAAHSLGNTSTQVGLTAASIVLPWAWASEARTAGLAGDLTLMGERVAPESATALAQRLGLAGEEAVGTTGPKVGIRIPGTDTMRFPDAVNDPVKKLTEVKNVQSLSYTQQLRDYSAWCQQQGYTFDLYVRPSTQMSGPLWDAIDSKLINLNYIPGGI